MMLNQDIIDIAAALVAFPARSETLPAGAFEVFCRITMEPLVGVVISADVEVAAQFAAKYLHDHGFRIRHGLHQVPLLMPALAKTVGPDATSTVTAGSSMRLLNVAPDGPAMTARPDEPWYLVLWSALN